MNLKNLNYKMTYTIIEIINIQKKIIYKKKNLYYLF